MFSNQIMDGRSFIMCYFFFAFIIQNILNIILF